MASAIAAKPVPGEVPSPEVLIERARAMVPVLKQRASQCTQERNVPAQTITEMQIKTMDHMMDAWEEQIKSPNPMTGSPSAMVSKLKSLPGVSPAGSWSPTVTLVALWGPLLVTVML